MKTLCPLIRMVIVFPALMVLLSSCQKTPVLIVNGPTTIELPADEDSNTISFTTNRNWSVSCSDPWLHVNTSSGAASDGIITLIVSSDSNTTYEDRSATVSIRAEDLVQTVTFLQSANIGIVLSRQSFDCSHGQNTLEIPVKHNVHYTIAINVDWIKQLETKGLTTDVLTFGIEENPSYDFREGTITIKPQSGNDPDKVVSIKQAASPLLRIKRKNYFVTTQGGTVEVPIQANVDFEVKTTADWIHYRQTKALENKTIVLSVEATKGSRHADVTVSQKEGGLSEAILICQDETPFAVDLGLSVKWADRNMGTWRVGEYGSYYSWGEMGGRHKLIFTGYSSYGWDTYEWSAGSSTSLIKYNNLSSKGDVDNKMVLEPEDDAAHMAFGEKWRMPTDAEFEELLSKCKWEWIRFDFSGGQNLFPDGPRGYLITGPNGRFIFLPASGYISSAGTQWKDEMGAYWSSSLDEENPSKAKCLKFADYDVSIMRNSMARNLGLSIRAVKE